MRQAKGHHQEPIIMVKRGLSAAMTLVVMVASTGVEAQTPIPPSPKDFVLAVTQSDHYELQAANAAIAQSRDPRVRTFAQDMIRDHNRLSDELRRAVIASGLPAPDPGMSGDQARLLGGLHSVQGSEFDKTYARQQVLGHAQAVAVEESFATAGSDPTLKNLAQSALPTIRDHLRMARQLRVEIDGATPDP